MTGDGQLVEVAAVAQFRIGRDPAALRQFAFGAADPEAALRPALEAALRDVIASRQLDDLLGTGRHEVLHAALARLRDDVSSYRLGVDVVSISFADLHPPLPVIAAYRDVSAAESDRQRRINEGEAERVTQVVTARGQAAATIEAAAAEREGRIALAAGEAGAFVDRHEARQGAPAVTDQRLYWDRIGSSLAGKRKVILDPSPANRRHLILPDVLAGPSAIGSAALLNQPPASEEPRP
jgi:regulator of protease activity HflC (stomatin/prohibitin superfamily)